MLVLSDLDMLIAMDSYLIDVPLSDAQTGEVFDSLTGTNPSRGQTRAEIRKIAVAPAAVRTHQSPSGPNQDAG